MTLFQAPPESYRRTCVKWDGGWLEFDVVVRQSIEHDGEITEHPVDSKGDITDHYRRYNVPLVLEAEITNSPLALPLTHTDGSIEIADTREIEIAAPIFPGAPRTFAGFDIQTKSTIRISPLAYAPALDRVNAVYQELDAIQAEARILTVSLGALRYPGGEGGDFDNMLLKRFSIDRDNLAGNALPLVLEFKHVRFAELTTVAINVKKPAKPRSSEAVNAGAQAAKAVSEGAGKSVAKRLFAAGG